MAHLLIGFQGVNLISALHKVDGFLNPKAPGKGAGVSTVGKEFEVMVRSDHSEGCIANIPEEGFAGLRHGCIDVPTRDGREGDEPVCG